MNKWTLLLRRLALWSYLPFFVLALSMIAISSWAGYTLWRRPYYGVAPYDDLIRLTSHGRITGVDPDGPAALVGVRGGDQIVAVDQRIPAPMASMYSSKSIGDHVILTLLRGDQPITAALLLTSPPSNITLIRLEPVLVGLVFWTVSFAVWLLRPFHTLTRLFFLIGQLTTGALATGSLSTIRWPMSALVFNSCLVLLVPLAVHFSATFPTVLAHPYRQLLLWVSYASALLLLLITISSAWWTDQHMIPKVFYRAGKSFAALMLLLTVILLLRRQRGLSQSIRQRQRLLLFGMAISVAPLLFLSLLPELVWGTEWLDYSVSIPFQVLLPFAFAFATYQGEFGRFRLFVHRNLASLMLIGTLLIVYMLIFSFMIALEAPYFSWIIVIVNTALATIGALVFKSVSGGLQQWIDRVFYNGWYSYRSIIRATSAEFSQVLERHEVVERLMQVARVMRFQSAIVLWPDDQTFVPIHSFGQSDDVLQLFKLPTSGSLIQYLQTAARPCWHGELQLGLAKAQLTGPERTLLIEHSFLWLPLVSRGVLHGALVMGEHQDSLLLAEEARDILTTLASQAAVTAENVLLLESLQTRLQAMGEMQLELAEAHRRLAESQEAERVHLAREIHDVAVQQLIGISYRLVESRRRIVRGGTPLSTELDTELIATLDTTRQQVLDVVTELRGMINALRPAGLDEFGLTVALESYVERLQREQRLDDIEIILDLPECSLDLPGAIALCLFRTAQEALHNAWKHAQARHITLAVEIRHDAAILRVADDGCGFVVPHRLGELTRHDHFGLVGMAERVAWEGGELRIDSQIGRGTTVRIRIPLPDREQNDAATYSRAVS